MPFWGFPPWFSHNQNDLFKPKSHHTTLWHSVLSSLHSELKFKSVHQPQRPYVVRTLGIPRTLSPYPLSPLPTPLWLLGCSLTMPAMLLPWGLCTACFLSQKLLPPNIHLANPTPPTAFSEANPGHTIQMVPGATRPW